SALVSQSLNCHAALPWDTGKSEGRQWKGCDGVNRHAKGVACLFPYRDVYWRPMASRYLDALARRQIYEHRRLLPSAVLCAAATPRIEVGIRVCRKKFQLS